MKNTTLLSYLELLIANVIWGGTFVAAKHALEAISPILLALTRFVISSLLFLPIIYLAWKKGQYIKKEDFKTIILLGLLGITFYFTFQFLGLEYTTATNASLLIALIPIFTLFFSAKILKEKSSLGKIGAIVISFFGAGLVIMNGAWIYP
ncbi:DMT family transporter [Patescibacteria group bacterium]|nr:DMT family transporter [Patescibacteria group bacterium]